MKEYIWIVASAFYAATLAVELYKDIAKRPAGLTGKGAIAYLVAVQSGLYLSLASFVLNILLCCFTPGQVFVKIVYVGGSAVCMVSSWVHGGLWKKACRKADKQSQLPNRRSTVALYADTVQKDLDYLRLQLCEALDWDSSTDVKQLQNTLAETNIRMQEICQAEDERLAAYKKEIKQQKSITVAKTVAPTVSLILSILAVVLVCI